MLRLFLIALATLTFAPVPEAQTLERIRETGRLQIGFRPDMYPLSYRNEDGNPAGFTPALCAQLAQGLTNRIGIANLDVSFIPVTAEDRYDRVAKGEVDLLCGAAAITLRARERVDFSVPVYVGGTAVMLPKEASGDLLKLVDKSVGVRRGTATEAALRNTLIASGLTMKIVAFEDYRDGMKAMEEGRIEAYFGDKPVLDFLLAQRAAKDGFRVSNDILTVEKQGLALARGDAGFRLMVDAALSDLFNNGAVQGIFTRALPGVRIDNPMAAAFLLSPTQP